MKYFIFFQMKAVEACVCYDCVITACVNGFVDDLFLFIM